MKSATLEHILRGMAEIRQEDRLYLIREQETVFYIGQSVDPTERLWEHIGRGHRRRKFPSPLGELIIACLHESMQWTMERYTVEECDSLVLLELSFLHPWYTTHTSDLFCQKRIIDTAEQALIKHYRPCFNVIHNLDPTPLPEKYEERLPPIKRPRLPWDEE